jgi:hypothetical protein
VLVADEPEEGFEDEAFPPANGDRFE